MMSHVIWRGALGFFGVLAIVAVMRMAPPGGMAAVDGAAEAGSQTLVTRFQYAHVAESEVVKMADLVARGTVSAVSDERWNQESGERWSMDDERPTELDHPPVAFPLQEVTVEVAETWRGAVDAAEPNLSFVVLGNGIGQEWNAEGGYLAPGTEVVLLLDRRAIAWRDGPLGRKEVLTLAGAYQGVYRVEASDRLANASTARQPSAAVPDKRATTVGALRALVVSAGPDA
jgi:hypothetical protein